MTDIMRRGSTRRPRVLVVDNEPMLLRAYDRLLDGWGFEAVTCTSVPHALACLLRDTFDAVMSDTQIAPYSGWDLLHVARAVDPDLPVLLLMGASPPGGTMQLQPGDEAAFCQLEKTGDLAELQAKLREAAWLTRNRRQRQRS